MKPHEKNFSEAANAIASAKITLFHARRAFQSEISKSETRAQLFEARLQTLTMHLERIRDFKCNNEEIAAARMRHIAKTALEVV